MYISTPPSSEVENLLPRQGSNPGPAEPEEGMLPSEPVRQIVTVLDLTMKKKKKKIEEFLHYFYQHYLWQDY